METKNMFDEQQAMQMALDISGNHVVCLDLKDNRVYDLFGKAVFGEEMGIEAYYAGFHPDDLEQFRAMVERMRSGSETEAEWHYRWNANLGGQGAPIWRDIHGHALTEFEDGKPVSIITTLIDETETKSKEREIERLSKRYWTVFENSIIGQSFYSPDGWLLDSNRIMRKICNFEEDIENEFYYKVNLFDIMPFNEVLDRYHPEDYWACSLSIVPEKNMYVYLEISVHPIYDEDGQLMYLSVTANDITEERNMYLEYADVAHQPRPQRPGVLQRPGHRRTLFRPEADAEDLRRSGGRLRESPVEPGRGPARTAGVRRPDASAGDPE